MQALDREVLGRIVPAIAVPPFEGTEKGWHLRSSSNCLSEPGEYMVIIRLLWRGKNSETGEIATCHAVERREKRGGGRNIGEFFLVSENMSNQHRGPTTSPQVPQHHRLIYYHGLLLNRVFPSFRYYIWWAVNIELHQDAN